ncbi:bifunctional glutamate N-acetyltransferase/amino-acid acetyltransferase ArgJ [Desulfococcaceae bacterium HSG7]|nr:bifunctional glutamate N-acetyltransferase/amino-acid acetyltransferase ArgJ [Desulfococcaceae bacterium HSG7]
METTIGAGFEMAGIASGIKKNNAPDLGLIYSQVPAQAAGVFTQNLVQAAPVILDKQRIKNGLCQAIIVNSGNANCCIGEQGMKDAEAMTAHIADRLNIPANMVLAASTGVIGAPLPIQKIEDAVPALVDTLNSKGVNAFAHAIMTTDTTPKAVSCQSEIEGKSFTVTGVAKGVGMINPDMATMLGFIVTDVGISDNSAFLHTALKSGVERSFNRITIDGDTSTNDTVLIMANGMSGAVVSNSAHRIIFQKVLDDVLITLARMLVKDGEGATKLVEITVKGAVSDDDALKIASTVANSSLVKTALFGEDANWGRILAAAGRAQAYMRPETTDIYFDNVPVCKNGVGCGGTTETDATRILKKSEFTIAIDLNQGTGSSSMLTCDFSLDYVKINADYRS